MEGFCSNVVRTVTHLLLILSIGTFGKVDVVLVPKLEMPVTDLNQSVELFLWRKRPNLSLCLAD